MPLASPAPFPPLGRTEAPPEPTPSWFRVSALHAADSKANETPNEHHAECERELDMSSFPGQGRETTTALHEVIAEYRPASLPQD